MQKLTLQETQAVLYEMLDCFATYCEEHQLRYYLVGGTLLGAVRHKGFIPWDDDIDVGMPRPDYERFLELTKEQPLAPHLKVLSPNTHTLTLPFVEIIHTGTKVERIQSRCLEEENKVLHLFMDVFPQDGWPSSERETAKLVKRMAFCRKLNLLSRAKLGEGATPVRAIAKIPALLVAKAISNRRILQYMDRYAKRFDYDTSVYAGAVTYGIYGIGERCRREEITKFVQVPFGNRTYNAPGCYDSYLSAIYGDYMILPPEEKRHNHELNAYIDKGE